MYKDHTKEDWEKILNFTPEYTVDALIVTGIAYREKELEIFKDVLSGMKNVQIQKNITDSFFKNIFEFKLNGKTIWFDIVYAGGYLSELTHIACIFGSKQNFLLGSCGGLQDFLKPNNIIIPTYSYGNESTTRMYQRDISDNKHFPDERLGKDISKNIDTRYTIQTGPIVTCQAMLGETKEDVEQWQRDGYLEVKMESSTLFAVSNHFNVPSTALLHVSDNLVKNKLVGEEVHTASKQLRKELKRYKYKIVFEHLSNA